MKNFYLLLFFSLMFFSCAVKEPYYVKINSITPNYGIEFNKTYTLLPLNTNTNDLYFKEYSLYVKYALSKKGYIFKDNETASMIIFLDYGNGNPETYYQNYSIPIYGTTTFSSYGMVGRTPIYNTSTSYSQQGTISGTKAYTINSNYIYLSACEMSPYKEKKQIIPLWETNIYSINDSGDLRENFPIMINTALPYIGEDSYKDIIVKKNISSLDNDIFIRNSLRKQLCDIQDYKSFINSKEIKEYQYTRDNFFEYSKLFYYETKNINKRALSKHSLTKNFLLKKMTPQEIYYYSSEKNYEYFNDIDDMLKQLKMITYPEEKNFKSGPKYIEETNSVKIQILQNTILSFIKQGIPEQKKENK
ncbi:MAG: hypothetical protein AB7E39_01475 [Endomicrobiaceae bacterium]